MKLHIYTSRMQPACALHTKQYGAREKVLANVEAMITWHNGCERIVHCVSKGCSRAFLPDDYLVPAECCWLSLQIDGQPVIVLWLDLHICA